MTASCVSRSVPLQTCRSAVNRDLRRYFPEVPPLTAAALPVHSSADQGRTQLTFDWICPLGLVVANVEVRQDSPPIVRYLELRGSTSSAAAVLDVPGISITQRSKPLIAGTVLDEQTDERLARFTVMCSAGAHTIRSFTNGRFVWKKSYYANFSHHVEAEGYRPFTSRRSPPQQTVSRRLYRLERDRGLRGVVVDIAGKQIAGSSVALADERRTAGLHGGSFKPIDPAKLKSKSDRRRQPYITFTDNNGEFKIPDWAQLSVLAAAHPDHGFAIATTDDLQAGKPLTLIPWGSVRGIPFSGTTNLIRERNCMSRPPASIRCCSPVAFMSRAGSICLARFA